MGDRTLRVLQMIRALLNAFKCAVNWVEALDHTSKSEYEAALEALQKADGILQTIENAKEESTLSIEFNLLKALLLYYVGRAIESFNLCENLLVRITKDERISHSDKIYLMSYTAWIANMNIDQIGGTFRDRHEVRELNLENVTLDAVSSHFRHNFPLRCHPEWTE